MTTPIPVPTAAGLEPAFDLAAYYPLLIFAAVVVGLALVTLASTHAPLIKPRNPTRVKLMPYESGMDPVGTARMQFDIKFYLIAILFLVFDVELLFLYPWAVASRDPLGIDAAVAASKAQEIGLTRGLIFGEAMVFIGLLTLGLVYAWRRGVFQWR